MNHGNKPLTLSIIIPVYNEARHLRDCLEAIANQQVKPDEVIIVDNNSTDESAEIARQFSFVKIVHEKKQGVVHARNKGFNSTKSDIIGRIDADTVLPKDWVGYIKGFFSDARHQNYAWAGGCVFRNTRFPRFYGWAQSQVAFRFNRLLMGHYILYGSNMAITRKQWRSVRSKTCLKNDIHEDLDLAIHLHELDTRIRYDAYIKASVIMRRVYKSNELKENLMLWPNTLRRHSKKTWIFGWLGAQYIYSLRWLGWLASSDKHS